MIEKLMLAATAFLVGGSDFPRLDCQVGKGDFGVRRLDAAPQNS
jgi:hypothetical protein